MPISVIQSYDAGPQLNEETKVLAMTAANGGRQLTAGSGLVLWIGQVNSSTKIYSVNDDGGNTWTALPLIVNTTRNRRSQLWYLLDVAGGDLTITVSMDSGSTTWTSGLIECAQLGSHDTDGSFESDVQTSSPVMASPGINTAGAGIICGVYTGDSTHGGCTPAAGYTETFDNGGVFFQYRITSASQSNETAQFTTGSGRRPTCQLGSWNEAAAPPAGSGGPAFRIMSQGDVL